MDLRDLRCLLAVVEEGSFSGAARREHLAQPYVSRLVRRLEREVGVALLVRSTRGVVPTEAGAAFLEEVRPALVGLDSAVDRARAVAAGRRGRLRVGVLASDQTRLTDGVVDAFCRAFPDVDVEVVAQCTAVNLTGLTGDDLDVAFVRPPVRGQPSIEVSVLFDEAMLGAHPVGTTWPEVTAHLPVVAFPPRYCPGMSERIGEVVAATAGNARGGVVQRPFGERTLAEVAAGRAWAAVPESHRAFVIDGVAYAAPDPPVRAEFGLAWRRADGGEPVVSSFAATAATVCRRPRTGLASIKT